MKYIFLLLTLLSFNLLAANGNNFQAAVEAASVEAGFEVDLNNVKAFDVVANNTEVEVRLSAFNNITQKDDVLTYGCHFHGTSMACHEEGHDHKLLLQTPKFKQFLSAFNTAMNKMAKTLSRAKLDLAAVTYVKAWKLQTHEHGQGEDFWTKINYNLRGKLNTVYAQCHQHAGEASFACHYKRSAEQEVVILGEDSHDH